jgi:2-polyprenyl-3-methyl-5-hydroxy-6-metoxy-1,4-benzoquinol methylase
MDKTMDLNCFCGSNFLNYLGRKQRTRIYQCKLCGTIFPEHYRYSEEFYRNEYACEFQKIKGHLPYTESYEHDCEVARNRLKPITKRFSPPISLLDIGAGTGAFVDEANKAGLDAYGIELMDFPNRRITRANFLTFSSDRRFDVVTLFDVLEHFPFPGFAITKTASLAKRIIVIDQPNPISDEAKREGINWKHIKPVEHNFLLSKTLLSQFLSYLEWNLSFETSQVAGRMYLIYERI